MVRVAIIYSIDGAPTAIAANIARHAIDILQHKGIPLSEFSVLGATRLPFYFSLLFRKYNAIFYFGHGWKNELMGQLPFGYIAPLIRVGDKVKTNITYAVACLAGQELGPWLAKNKIVKASIMNTNYTYMALPSTEHDYLSDFVDIFTSPIRLLADGKTASQAYKELIRKIQYYMDLYKKNLRRWSEADFYLYALEQNHDFKLFGDPDATIFD